MAKVHLSYRQRIKLGSYLAEHFLTEDGKAVQVSDLTIHDMLAELNSDLRPGEVRFKDTHVHYARNELFGPLARPTRSPPSNGSAAQAELISTLTLRLEALERTVADLNSRLSAFIPLNH